MGGLNPMTSIRIQRADVQANRDYLLLMFLIQLLRRSQPTTEFLPKRDHQVSVHQVNYLTTHPMNDSQRKRVCVSMLVARLVQAAKNNLAGLAWVAAWWRQVWNLLLGVVTHGGSCFSSKKKPIL